MSTTTPLPKTPTAAPAPVDFSVYGVILPVLTTEPTDATFGGAVVDGMTVYQASPTDTSFVQWVRINGAWRTTFMAT